MGSIGIAAAILILIAAIATAGIRELTRAPLDLELAMQRAQSLDRLNALIADCAGPTLDAATRERIDSALAAVENVYGSDSATANQLSDIRSRIEIELFDSRARSPDAFRALRDQLVASLDGWTAREASATREELESQRAVHRFSAVTGLLAAVAALVGIFVFVRRLRKFERASDRDVGRMKEDLAIHQALLHSAGDAVATADARGRITLLNSLAEELTGWSVAEAQGRPLEEVVRIEASHARSWLDSTDRTRPSSQPPRPRQTILRTRDGSTRTIEENAVVFRDAQGARRGIIVVFRDLSKSLDNERALRERVELAEFESEIVASLLAPGRLEQGLERAAQIIQRRLQSAFTSIWLDASDGFGLRPLVTVGDYSHLDTDRNQRPIGEHKVRLIAEARKPLLSNNVIGDHRVVDQEWARREGLVAFAGYPLVQGDRLIGVVAMFARHSLSDATLEALSLVSGALSLDIERKLAERALLDREARFRSLVTASTQLVWRSDAAGAVIEDVSSWRSNTGEEFESFHGNGWLAFVHPDDYDSVVDRWRVGIESRAPFEFELRLMRSDRKYRRMLLRAVPILDEDGAIREWIGTHTDITVQRIAEESLRESEYRYRALVELSAQAVWLADASGAIDYANHWLLEYSGMTLESLRTAAAFEIVHPDHREALRNAWDEHQHDPRPFALEIPLRRGSTGEYRWHIVRSQPIRDESGRVTRWIGVALDIDDRRRNERDRMRLAFLVENSRDWVGIFDREGRGSYVNGAGRRLIGIADDAALPAIQLADLFHAEDRALVTGTLFPRAMLEGVATAEVRARRRDDSVVWVDLALLSMRSGDGSFDGVAVIARDITDRRNAQEQIAASQRLITSALDALASMIVVLDERGTILAVNESWRRRAASRERTRGTYEVGSNHLEDWANSPFVDTATIESARQSILDVISGAKATSSIEFRFHDPSVPHGEEWFLMRVTPFHAPGPLRIVVAYENITVRVQSEVATTRRSEQLQRLSRLATNMSMLHDVDSVLGVITESARAIVGAAHSFARIDGDQPGDPDHTFASATDASLSPLEVELGDVVRRTAQPRRIDDAAAHADTELRAIVARSKPLDHSWMIAPLTRRNGSPCGVLWLRDRTDRGFSADDEAILVQLAHTASIAIENARLYARLVQADRRKDQFLATLGHELRNPLAPVRFWLEILRLDRSPSTLERAHHTIERQIRHMVRLIDDLLDLSRISFDKLQLRLEPTPLASAIEAAIEACEPMIEEKGQRLTTRITAPECVIYADPTRVAQIVSNLLNNASKYSGTGSAIELELCSDGDDAVVRVRDEGIGIPHDAIATIFDPFMQGERSTPLAQGGLGIGLSLVRRIVELHGGSVVARSAGPDRGSEFEVRLPRWTEPLAPGSTRASEESRPTRRRRVLIADDNRDSAESLTLLLELEGHECRKATDGATALQLFEEFQPEVVLLDIGLPDLSGYEVARGIRERAGGSNVVLVAITGWGQPDDRNRSKEVGFDQHFVKPIEFDRLQRFLAKLP